MPRSKKTQGKKANKGKIFVFYRYAIIAFFVLVFGTFVIKLISSVVSYSADRVLGSSTLLARGGDDSSDDDDDGSSSGSGSNDSGSSGSSDSESSGSSNSSSGSSSSNSGSGSNDSGSQSSGGSNSQASSSIGGVSGETRVDCVGPDGKTFKSTFDACKDLNEAWGNANFKFTTISSGSNKSNTNIRIFDSKSVETEDEDELEDEIESETEIEDEDETDEVEAESAIKVKTEPEETKIKISEGERIRVRTKDGRTRIDITSGGIKTRLEYRDDRVIIKAENENGTEEELEDDTIFKIVDRLDASGIKVATSGAGGFVFQRGNAGAVTEFPLSIDLATNTLFISTPAGEKQVSVLPDQAIDNLLAANVINNLIKTQALNADQIESVEQVMTLGESQGELVYQIQGISNQKLLGLIPVLIERTVTVSAEDGGVVQTQELFIDRILDAISF